MKFIILSLVAFILGNHSVYSQERKELYEKWNMREKDRLITSIDQNDNYLGVFYDNYEAIAHQLIVPKIRMVIVWLIQL